MTDEKVSVKVDMDVQVPSLPNFLQVKRGDTVMSLPLAHFDERTLHHVGKQWLAAFVAKAKKK